MKYYSAFFADLAGARTASNFIEAFLYEAGLKVQRPDFLTPQKSRASRWFFFSFFSIWLKTDKVITDTFFEDAVNFKWDLMEIH